jgi:hypothetical protein
MSKTSDLSFSHVDGIGNRGWRDGVIPVLSASAFTQLVTAFMAPPGPLQACPASGAAGSLYQRPPLRRTCAATRVQE